jgi:C_GCAxxG_C_C family probable redox protein
MKMDRKDQAAQSFDGSYNCSQAVLASFAGDFNLDLETAVKLAAGFGAGMSRSCQVCGALSGAYMVIGLKFGSDPSDAGNFQEQKKTYLFVADFMDRFLERNGSLNCRELTGYDLGDPAQHAQAKQDGVFAVQCVKYVKDAVEITEELIG